MSRLFYVVLFMCVSTSMLGQKGILIFEEGEDYLTSEIENSIRNLFNFTKDRNLFDAVVSRKGLVGHLNYEAKIDELLQQYSYEEYSYNEEVANTREKISQFLSAPDFIMLVNVKLFRESLGVQFNLFQQKAEEDSVADSLDYGRLLTAFDKTYYKRGAETFFVNSGKNNHLQLIDQAFSRLFPESQAMPEIEVLVDENVFHKGDKFTFSVEDTIVLDATFSEGGNEKYPLSYEWIQVYPKSMDLVDKMTSKIVFNRKRAIVRFSPDKPGEYFFLVEVEDGINKATSDTVFIEVISPVRLEKNQRSEIVDLYLWNPKIRQAGGKIVDYTFLNASNYSLGRDSQFSITIQEAINLDKGYVNVEGKRIKELLNDSIKVREDFFYLNRGYFSKRERSSVRRDSRFINLFSNADGDDVVLKEVYCPPFIDSQYNGLNRKNVVSLSYNDCETNTFALDKKFRVHSPVEISEKMNFSSIVFSSTVDEVEELFTRNFNYTTTELDLVLSESIRLTAFKTNKEYVFRDKFYENVFLDSFQVGVNVPFYQSLEVSGARLAFFSGRRGRFQIRFVLGLTRYRYLDGTLSDDEISIFQAAAGLEESAPENEIEVSRLIGLSRLVNIIAGGDSEDLSATAFVLGAGVELSMPVANLPIYLRAGYFNDMGSKKLPFSLVNTLHLGVSVDIWSPNWRDVFSKKKFR